MTDEPKVSIISPCYNGENYLHNFLESLIIQDYGNIVFYFVDDGSTDNTKDIFYSYIPKLEAKGWFVKYIFKENGGIASAINAALPLISGKYLIWPDCDDILYPNHISEKVKYMDENPEYGIAYCDIDIVKISDIENIIKTNDLGKYHKNAFNNILNNRLWVYAPIGVIVRCTALDDVIPNREIPNCKGAQNCQIQMPVLYKYKCGYINQSLGKYVLHSDSHSRINSKKFLNRRIQIIEVYIATILTLRYATKFEKFIFILITLKTNILMIISHYLMKIFSIKNKKKRVIITIFGIKIKISKTKNFNLEQIPRHD